MFGICKFMLKPDTKPLNLGFYLVGFGMWQNSVTWVDCKKTFTVQTKKKWKMKNHTLLNVDGMEYSSSMPIANLLFLLATVMSDENLVTLKVFKNMYIHTKLFLELSNKLQNTIYKLFNFTKVCHHGKAIKPTTIT